MASRGILLKVVCGMAVSVGSVSATPPPLPVWWDTSVIASPAAPAAANYAPANQGQLKNIAKKASNYLDGALGPGVDAGPAVHSLVTGFTHTATDYSPINLGQLKAVAAPFYARLIALGYDTRANLIARGYPSTWTSNYPWDDTPSAMASHIASNYSLANIGQVKMVFSFDLTGFTPIIIPDPWEIQYFGQTGISPLADSDNDGVSNADEYAHGTDPTKADNPKVQLNVSVFLN